ncbi:MAG: inositol monophosphatase [Dermatophilaceae bacterium]|nr:inositol monophosphatase [Intrasporangiaceae bacterium]
MPGRTLATDEVLTLLQDVAAELITPRFRALAKHHISEKTPGSLVTIADHEAEVAITQALTAAYPEAVVLGEEAYEADPSVMDRYSQAEHAFTVDPVDGTRNFVHGSPDHAVMVAETRGAEIIRAWIWQPEHRLAWVAERGSGTWCNGERVQTQPVQDGAVANGATSLRSLRKRGLGGLPLHASWFCCGVDYPRLIEGKVDFLLYKHSYPWDHAPGALLVAEAGGRVGQFDGADYDPRSTRPGIVVASDPATFDTVTGLLPSDLLG